MPGSVKAAAPNLLSAALRVPLDRWPLLLLCCLISVAVALGVAWKFRTKTWRLEGSLFYSPLALTDAQKSVYTSMSVDTHLELLRSQKIFATLREEFDLTIPVEVLRDKVFKIDKPRNSDKVSVTLNWPDGEAGARMVNRLMALFIDYDMQLRKEKLAEEIAGHERYLAGRKKRLAEIQEEYGRALDASGARDVKQEIDLLAKDVSAGQAALNIAVSKEKTLAAQLQRIEPVLGALATRLDKGETPELPEQETDKSFFEERKLILEKIRSEENELAVLKTEFDAKNKERMKTIEGVARGFIAKSTLETINKEFDSLKKKREIHERTIKEKAEELRRLPHKVLSVKRSELNSQRASLAAEIAQIRATLDADRQKQRAKENLLKKIEPWERQLKELDQERLRYEMELAALAQLENSKTSEFRVEASAEANPDSVSTNRLKLLVGGFAIPFVVLFGLVIGWDLLQHAGRATTVAANLGLPVLAQCQRGAKKRISGPEARGLALRLRQYVPDSGAVVLFSSVQDGADVDEVVWETSRYSAMRDEKVLIVDARIARGEEAGLPPWIERTAPVMRAEAVSVEPADDEDEAGLTGLVQYLVFEGQDPLKHVWPTRVPAVDYLPAGGPYPVTDVLASQPMKDVLDLLAKRYSLLILVGPSLTSRVDTEILAAYAQGVVVMLNGPRGGLAAEVADVFQSLKEAEAPLLGAVVCE